MVIPDTPNSFYADVATTRGGTDHYVWEEKLASNDKYAVYYKRRLPDGTFTEKVRLSKQPYAEMPSISVAGRRVVVAYQARKGTVINLFTRTSLDGGLTWD